jgi:pilus assembly protein FimV
MGWYLSKNIQTSRIPFASMRRHPLQSNSHMHTKLTSSSRTQLQTIGSTWRVTAMTAALGALLSMAHLDANALALGRITALSSLGEPLVAGIEVPDINAEEAASLKATLASPDAFRAAGMEYNPALANAQITLNKRANGSSYLLVRSDKVVTDPFLNLVVNANWANGRIVRNYTLLLDPPAPKQAETVTAPIAALPTPAPAPAPVPAPAPAVAAAPVATPAVIAAPVQTPTPAPAPAQVAMPKAVTQKANVTTNTGEQVKVAVGDTAGKIAANNLPASVSLDQMLVALLRGNPQAFIGNNINRLKAGTVLDLPTEAEAAAISAGEARQSLVAQSKDFNSFRRKLAENAPVLASKSTDRVASGKIEAKVDDKKAAVVTPDKLTLSKGGLKADDKAATASKENLDKIAKERQAKDDAARTAELAKNIKDLNKIAGTAPAAAAVATTAAKPTTPPAVPVAAAVVAPAPAPAKTVAATTTPAAPVSPVTPKPVVKAPVVVAPVVEPSPIDFLMEDPVVLPAAGGLLALLLVGGLYANNKRKKRRAAEDAEDDLLADNFSEKSFFSDTSNEPIMGHEAPVHEPAKAPVVAAAQPTPVAVKPVEAVVSSHATVVDPLTEADVYLDYGRDVQAEEILKVALKTQPENATIYTKLMGIYAKRRDAKNFEQMALKAKLLLTESDPQWSTISKQGFELEPTNPLYAAGAPELDDSFAAMSSSEFSTRTVAQLNPETAKSPASVDLDLDFDFVSSFPTPSAPEAPKTPLMDFPDFSLEPAKKEASATAVAPAIATSALIATAAAIASPAAKPAAMEFDMGGLSLDLNSAAKPPAATATAADNNGPMETKLALAQEFRSIGDNIGAKMLVNEVIAHATGPLKLKAENLLAELG